VCRIVEAFAVLYIISKTRQVEKENIGARMSGERKENNIILYRREKHFPQKLTLKQ
jgi:hypothetical protein